MIITLESTSRMVTLVIDGRDVPARVWQGHTDFEAPVAAMITRIAPLVRPGDADYEAIISRFDQELKHCADPCRELEGIPLRMIVE